MSHREIKFVYYFIFNIGENDNGTTGTISNQGKDCFIKGYFDFVIVKNK